MDENWGLWNLIVVICFALLYWAVSLVFLQIRRMRDELKIQNTPTRFPDLDEADGPAFQEEPAPLPQPFPAIDPALLNQNVREAVKEAVREFAREALREALRDTVREGVRRELPVLEKKLNELAESFSSELQRELGTLQREMRYLERGVNALNAPQTMANRTMGNEPVSAKDEAYREARLLLANGVDEERVIDETGLSVEEVSLLRRLAQDNRPLP